MDRNRKRQRWLGIIGYTGILLTTAAYIGSFWGVGMITSQSSIVLIQGELAIWVATPEEDLLKATLRPERLALGPVRIVWWEAPAFHVGNAYYWDRYPSDSGLHTGHLVGIPLYWGFLASALQFVPVWLRRHRSRMRMRHGLCVECGYNLAGGPHVKCPECGVNVSGAGVIAGSGTTSCASEECGAEQ